MGNIGHPEAFDDPLHKYQVDCEIFLPTKKLYAFFMLMLSFSVI